MSKKGDINQVILFQLDQTNKVVKNYSQREFDRLGLGITVEQWVLLKIIEESRELSQRELAEQSLRDPASITRTLDLLERKKLIKRQPLETDRRQYQLVLTRSGKSFVDKHMPLVRKQRAQSTKGFSEKELDQLTRLLGRIRENMT